MHNSHSIPSTHFTLRIRVCDDKERLDQCSICCPALLNQANQHRFSSAAKLIPHLDFLFRQCPDRSETQVFEDNQECKVSFDYVRDFLIGKLADKLIMLYKGGFSPEIFPLRAIEP